MSKKYLSKLTDVHSHVIDSPITNLPFETGKIWLMSTTTNDWATVGSVAKSNDRFLEFYGIHPWFSGKVHTSWLQDLERLLIESPRALIGEIGLDNSAKDSFSGLKYDFETQLKVFSAQFDLACKLGRPVSIHAVQVPGKLLDFLSQQERTPPSIMLHSFNASSDIIKRLLKLKGIGERLYFSVSAVVNLRSKKFNDMVSLIPDHKILIESDCHDINAVDHAMQTILEKVAEAKGWDIDTAVSILSKNTDNYLTIS